MRSLVGSVALLALAGTAGAQEPDTTKRVVRFSGFAEVSYVSSTRRRGD
jgi:hypothetical protein